MRLVYDNILRRLEWFNILENPRAMKKESIYPGYNVTTAYPSVRLSKLPILLNDIYQIPLNHEIFQICSKWISNYIPSFSLKSVYCGIEVSPHYPLLVPAIIFQGDQFVLEIFLLIINVGEYTFIILILSFLFLASNSTSSQLVDFILFTKLNYSFLQNVPGPPEAPLEFYQIPSQPF